ncbi:MAG: hypothetical protein LQ338_007576 [Usnochroma carphineum]|nr:MAG: hypothetical protein LQ338_007576 [Usnochroma carphineum]
MNFEDCSQSEVGPCLVNDYDYDFSERCDMCREIGKNLPLKPALLPEHFKAMAQTSAEFDDYLTGVYGGSTHKDKARMAEIRNDDWRDHGVETPTGKKYSTERAQRPIASIDRGVAAMRLNEQIVSEPLVQKGAAAPDVTEAGGGELGEDEEYRLWREGKQRNEREKREKLRRFKLREKETEEGQ